MRTPVRVRLAAVTTLVALVGGSSMVVAQSPSAVAPVGSQAAVGITLAHSYQDAQPQHACGAQVIADAVAASGTGLGVEIFGASQLGGDADRITSVAAGDIDMDIQGASALSALYAPMSVVDGAFVFDDAEHLKRFFTDEASTAAQGRVPGRDRRARPGRLVGGRPPVHGQQADPDPGRPAWVFGCASRRRRSS